MWQGYSSDIPSLVGLVRSGNDSQKVGAARALRSVAVNDVNGGNLETVASAVGIPRLMRSGNDGQKKIDAAALWNISVNAAEQEKIASAGSILQLVELVKSGNDRQNENAAGALRNLSVYAAKPEKIASAGGIPPLVELTRSWNNDLKETAAGALMHLSVNAANQEKIASAGGIPPLVELVRSGNDLQKEKAAGTLMNLSVNAANQEKIASAGGIPPLVELVRSGNDLQKEKAAGTLMNLSVNAANQEKIASAGGIPPLVELVKSGNDLQKEKAAGALGNLSKDAANQAEIAWAGGIPPLVELVKRGNNAQKEKAAGALRNLSSNAANKEKIASAGGIPSLVELTRSWNNDLKETAAGALMHLSLNAANQEKIASAGGIPPLVELVRSGNDLEKEKAAGTLMNLSVNAANQEKIASAGGIPPLVELVKSGNDLQKEKAAGALGNLSKDAANQAEIAWAGGIPPLVELVKRGNNAQKEKAAGALRNLSSNAANKEKIASAGGIPPLVELVRSGNDLQKEKATGALWNLALENTELRDIIASQSGAVDQLVNLALEGTQLQRELAAGVLGFLASHLSSEVKMKVSTEGGIVALLLWIVRPENAEWTHEGLIALQGLCTDGKDTLRAIVKKLDGHMKLSSIRESDNERNKMLANQILEWLEGDFANLSKLCQRMGEAKPLCSHVMERMRALEDRDADSVGAARSRLRAVLVMNGDKSIMVQIVSARSLANTLADVHLELDSIGQQASTGDWQPRWKTDRDAMMQKLFDVDIWSLVKTLEGAKAHEEALVLLLHEIKEKKDAYTKQQRRFLQELLNRLAGFSSLGIPVDEKWFIPRTDVEVEDESFNGGAFGKVYYGKYMNAEVVVKSVDIKSESDRKDFLREVKVWHEASIHPNIAQLYGACHVGEPCFMVCKYISGGSLRGYLQRQQELGRDCVWRALLGVTRGLQLLHSKGIIHADLKGDNILVEGDTAMITDFGMSFFEAETQPEFGNLGAIRWRAPEFIATKKASFEADVYSLGMCIVEAETGKLPWGMLPDIAVQWHLNNNKFLTRPKSMSDDEWALVSAMCDFDPSKRTQLAEVESQIYEFSELEAEEEDTRRRIARAAS